jgi:hypothetical protein
MPQVLPVEQSLLLAPLEDEEDPPVLAAKVDSFFNTLVLPQEGQATFSVVASRKRISFSNGSPQLRQLNSKIGMYVPLPNQCDVCVVPGSIDAKHAGKLHDGIADTGASQTLL